MRRTGLRDTINRRASNGAKSLAGDIDTLEHSIQQLRLSTGSRSIERFLQPVGLEIPAIERKVVEKLETTRTDIADVDCHGLTDAPLDTKREVLNVRCHEVGVVEVA